MLMDLIKVKAPPFITILAGVNVVKGMRLLLQTAHLVCFTIGYQIGEFVMRSICSPIGPFHKKQYTVPSRCRIKNIRHGEEFH